MQNLIKNAIIIYKNGLKTNCDAISITEKGVYTGYIKSINGKAKEFVNHGFIPKNRILQIMIFSGNGKIKNIDFNKKEVEKKNEKKSNRNSSNDADDCNCCFTSNRNNE